MKRSPSSTPNKPLPAPRARGLNEEELFSRRQIRIHLRNAALIAGRPPTGDIMDDKHLARVMGELTMWLGVNVKEMFKECLGRELDAFAYDFMVSLCANTARYLFTEAYGTKDEPELREGA